MRLIILESDRHSLWIKAIGITLIAVRFADWPYELTFQNVVHDIMNQQIQAGGTCWVQWYYSWLGPYCPDLFRKTRNSLTVTHIYTIMQGQRCHYLQLCR